MTDTRDEPPVKPADVEPTGDPPRPIDAGGRLARPPRATHSTPEASAPRRRRGAGMAASTPGSADDGATDRPEGQASEPGQGRPAASRPAGATAGAEANAGPRDPATTRRGDAPGGRDGARGRNDGPRKPRGPEPTPFTVWGRNRDNDSLDALAFLKEKDRMPARLLDVDRQPPSPREWAQISAGLGSLADIVERRNPRWREVFFDLDRADEKRIAMRLHENRDLIRCPILLHPDGALVGFHMRRWKEFFNVR